MTSTLHDPAVRGYLDELRRLLADAPDRDLVVEGVERHIEDALGEGPADPERVQEVLDELGDPAVIAADATPAESPAAPVRFLERRSGALVAVLVLTFGGLVVPLVGWIVGLVLLWLSPGWRLIDKLAGTLGVPALTAATAAVVALFPREQAQPCSADGLCAPVLDTGFPSHLAIISGAVIAVIAVAVFLLLRFRPARTRG